MKVTRHTLKNGLRTVIVEMAESNVVSTSVYVGAGGRYETPDLYGISHFLEHMAFKGTFKYPTAEDYANAIESIGGKQNAWTSHDHTGYWNIVPKEHALLAFDSLAEQLTDLILDPEEIDKERGVIIEEINMVYDNPSDIAWHKLGEVMWPGQSIGSDLLGPKSNIKKFKRNDFIEYKKPLYVAKNMTLCVAGGIKALEVIEMLESFFGKIPEGEKVTPPMIMFDQNEPRVGTFYKDSDQSHVILAYKTFSLYDSRRYILDILVAILGSGMGSVLFKEIRERRGLAYAIYVLTDYYSEFGALAIYAGLNKEKTIEAIEVIKEQLEISKDKIFTDDVIKRAKEYVKGGYVISLENAKNLSNWYAEREFLEPEKPEPKEIRMIIDKITAEEIIEVAKTIFRPEAESLVISGPFKDKEKFVKILLK